MLVRDNENRILFDDRCENIFFFNDSNFFILIIILL